MKRSNRKGFTTVELVIVIAVIAILAAVMIPTFVSLIKKAEESAYLQEKTNQMILDMQEEVLNQDYITWQEFEDKLNKLLDDKLALIGSGNLTEDEVKSIINAALENLNTGNNGLTKAQIEKIIKNALKEKEDEFKGLTKEEVEQIIKDLLENWTPSEPSEPEQPNEPAATLVGSASAFKAALVEGANIQLTTDITLNEYLVIPNGATIDLANHVITFADNMALVDGVCQFIEIPGTATIKNGTFVGTANNDDGDGNIFTGECQAIVVFSVAGNLTLENVNVDIDAELPDQNNQPFYVFDLAASNSSVYANGGNITVSHNSMPDLPNSMKQGYYNAATNSYSGTWSQPNATLLINVENVNNCTVTLDAVNVTFTYNDNIEYTYYERSSGTELGKLKAKPSTAGIVYSYPAVDNIKININGGTIKGINSENSYLFELRGDTNVTVDGTVIDVTNAACVLDRNEGTYKHSGAVVFTGGAVIKVPAGVSVQDGEGGPESSVSGLTSAITTK